VARRSRLVVYALLALLVGAGGVWLLILGRSRSRPPPEVSRSYFVSIIVFNISRQPMPAARRLAEAAYERIREGTPFEEVARAQSQDDGSRLMGGLIGLIEVPMDQVTAFMGAIQTLAEGQTSPPVFTGRDWIVIHRHPYEEGRELERKWLIPQYGFRVAWRDLPGGGPDRSRAEAQQLATTAAADVRAGRLTIAEARARYGEPDERPATAWLDLLRLRPTTDAVYQVLAKTPPGGVPEPVETAEGYLVMQRGHFFRSVVRNILVRHVESEGRPLNERKLKPEAEAKAREALGRALADPSRWDDVVRAYSDELDSIDNHGFIGCLAPGSLPPQMAVLQDAILATPVGKIHPKVVESPYGFHVVWRVD
jgi:hypothetical protein